MAAATQLSAAAGIGIELLFTILALFFLFMRLYVRVWLQCKFSTSDAFLVLAGSCLVVCVSFDVACFHWGIYDPSVQFAYLTIAQAEQLIPDQNRLITIFKLFYIYLAFYYTELWAVKAAFIVLYYSMLDRKDFKYEYMRWSLNAITVFTVSGYVVTVGMNMFWCTPVSNNWSLNQDKLCYAGDGYTVWFTGVGLHLASDIAVFVYPFFLISLVKLPRAKRIAVSAMFALGFIDILCTIGKTACLGLIFSYPVTSAWEGTEMGIAIMVACCPSLKWLYLSRKYYPSVGNELQTRSEADPNSTSSGGGSGERDEWGTYTLNGFGRAVAGYPLDDGNPQVTSNSSIYPSTAEVDSSAADDLSESTILRELAPRLDKGTTVLTTISSRHDSISLFPSSPRSDSASRDGTLYHS